VVIGAVKDDLAVIGTIDEMEFRPRARTIQHRLQPTGGAVEIIVFLRADPKVDLAVKVRLQHRPFAFNLGGDIVVIDR